MMSDVCKHCVQAGCLEVCPTGAIIRTEFDTVVIQSDTCNGCRDCIAACPFGVIDINPVSNTAQKCTLCYDRLQNGLEPACSKACPTDSIQFGPIGELRERAGKRVEQLHAAGEKRALPLRRRREDARRPELVLPAGRQARGLRAAARPEAAQPQPRARLALRGARRAPGRADRASSTSATAARGEREEARHDRRALAAPGSPSSPHWRWLIVFYFFLGGLAGGCYFLAALHRPLRPAARTGRSRGWATTSRCRC